MSQTINVCDPDGKNHEIDLLAITNGQDFPVEVIVFASLNTQKKRKWVAQLAYPKYWIANKYHKSQSTRFFLKRIFGRKTLPKEEDVSWMPVEVNPPHRTRILVYHEHHCDMYYDVSTADKFLDTLLYILKMEGMGVEEPDVEEIDPPDISRYKVFNDSDLSVAHKDMWDNYDRDVKSREKMLMEYVQARQSLKEHDGWKAWLLLKESTVELLYINKID